MAKRIGLVVGNQTYDDPVLRALAAPRTDAAHFAGVLRHREIGGFDEVDVLLDASDKDFRLAVARFCANRVSDDTLLLYFSGHGILDEEGLLHLAARDTQSHYLQATAVPAEFLRSQLNRSNSRRQIVILDCCHSGAYLRGAKGAPGAAVSSGTALITAGYGRVVLTASDATQYAWDGEAVAGEASTSVFTGAIVEGLQTGAADLDGDGQITIDELYEYVYRQTVAVSAKQTPAKFSDRQQGPIFVARSIRPSVNESLLPADLLDTIKDPRTWIREGAVLELGRVYMEAHLGRAATAEYLLRDRAENDDSNRVRANANEMLRKRASPVVARQSVVPGGDSPEAEALGAHPDESAQAVKSESQRVLAPQRRQSRLSLKVRWPREVCLDRRRKSSFRPANPRRSVHAAANKVRTTSRRLCLRRARASWWVSAVERITVRRL